MLTDCTLAGDTARARPRREHLVRLCAGHFPDDPLLPGAYVMALLAELAGLLCAARGDPGTLRELVRGVFRLRLTPDDAIVLTATVAEPGLVEVAAWTDGACAAEATLRFGVAP